MQPITSRYNITGILHLRVIITCMDWWTQNQLGLLHSQVCQVTPHLATVHVYQLNQLVKSYSHVHLIPEASHTHWSTGRIKKAINERRRNRYDNVIPVELARSLSRLLFLYSRDLLYMGQGPGSPRKTFGTDEEGYLQGQGPVSPKSLQRNFGTDEVRARCPSSQVTK